MTLLARKKQQLQTDLQLATARRDGLVQAANEAATMVVRLQGALAMVEELLASAPAAEDGLDA